ncbi:MAG: SHOCT domain-containing protein [Actinomycetota bacterium]
MTHMDWMMGPGMWFAMWIFPLLFFGVLIAFGVWAVRRFTERGPRSSARQILEERFARGEIDTEEFERRVRALER